MLRRLDRRLDRRLALLDELLRELDDQDRVLRREADRREQADLEVDVVRLLADAASRPPRRARRAARRASPRPGSTSSRRARRGTGTRRAARARRASARSRRTVCSSYERPVPVDSRCPRGSCVAELLHRRHRLARARARRRLALDRDRREAVEALELRRAVDPAPGRERRERHHLALAVAHVPAVEVLGLHAERRVGLHVDALRAARCR